MEIKVVNKGDGIKAFQHLGSVISLAPGETFNSNLDFTVSEKQVILSQPELEYSNSEQEFVTEVETKKPEPKKEEKVEEVKAETPEAEEEKVEEAEVEAKSKKKSSKK